MPENSGVTVSGQSHITIVHEFFSQTSVRCYLESTVYPSHVREILFLGSCLIHDFPSIYERGGRRIVDRVALSRRSTLRFVPLIAGKMQGTVHAVSHDASTLSIFTSAQGDSTRQFLWFNGRNERWIKFRFGTLVSKPPYLPLSPSTMNCCCSFVVAKKKKEFKRKFNSPCFSWKRNKRIFRMYVVDKEDERGIWLSESKFSLITSNLR